ncbi:hypothetical protein [Mycolicibacterium doricum]|uniref:hypothetical protein n=1 Tax=Mycolicibacterium doricum TaxID=126673 RepID=UPI001F3321F4|nr:hypothetical protein [Mycolicibacterium doricum]
MRLATPQGGATIVIGDRRVELVGDGADSDVTPDVVLTGEVDVLAGATEAVRRLAEVFTPPRVRL